MTSEAEDRETENKTEEEKSTVSDLTHRDIPTFIPSGYFDSLLKPRPTLSALRSPNPKPNSKPRLVKPLTIEEKKADYDKTIALFLLDRLKVAATSDFMQTIITQLLTIIGTDPGLRKVAASILKNKLDKADLNSSQYIMEIISLIKSLMPAKDNIWTEIISIILGKFNDDLDYATATSFVSVVREDLYRLL